jgi:hypothetical protein
MSGKVIKLLNTKKALELTGYRSINSLLQLHASEDVALTCYKVAGGQGRGGVGQAWSEKELKEFMRTTINKLKKNG